jgi:hypothetical protein
MLHAGYLLELEAEGEVYPGFGEVARTMNKDVLRLAAGISEHG